MDCSPGAFGKFVRISIALSARAPSLFASDAALSECTTKVQLFFRTAKFHGKKSLHSKKATNEAAKDHL